MARLLDLDNVVVALLRIRDDLRLIERERHFDTREHVVVGAHLIGANGVISRGRFGFTVQGRLLTSCNGVWEQLWEKLAWKQGGQWTRYPSSFQWSIEAPEGHMPLVNQLRGVRLMDALLQHPGLQQRIAA